MSLRIVIEIKTALAMLAASLLLAACHTTPNRAPVEERSALPKAGVGSGAVPLSGASAVPPVDPAKQLPGVENAGRPGYYTVKPGDTLIRIALDNGQNWKDLVRWNTLDNPNLIEVGQVLRVVTPGLDPALAATRPVASSRVETRPLDARVPGAPASGVVANAPTAAASSPIAVLVPTPAAAAPKDGDEDVNWGWPAAGAVIGTFDDQKVKGLVFGGKAGDPIYAAADGRVMYAGSGLRSYGNLIILKHNNTYLTAYAHNQMLLVKEDQVVRRGQKIAEMGSTDSDTVKLQFEVRKLGKPVDPAKLLPAR